MNGFDQQNDRNTGENENLIMDQRMEVEHLDEYSLQNVPHVEEIHPLALVAIDVNYQPISINEPQVPANIVVDGEDQAESEINRNSHVVSNSHVESPINFEEGSNHSEDSNSSVPNSSSKKRAYDEPDDDGSICPICFDSWTNTGDHRLCALKCGHLFGYECISKWVDKSSNYRCPTCKKRFNMKDVRHIYARKLLTVDTTELECVKKKLETVTEERNRFQTELATRAYRERLLNQEITQLKTQIKNMKSLGVPNVPNNAAERVKLYMDKAMEICKLGGSRVFDARTQLDLLMASMKSPTGLFNGYGLKKISISDYRTIAFIPAHSLQIRDICFHKENNWVLTASMDKTFKVINNQENNIIYQFSHQMPLWSCCWDLHNPFGLYIGTQSGSVIKYDIRQLVEPVATYAIQGDMSPVVSVASIPPTPGAVLPRGGVISCKLNSLWLFEYLDGNHIKHSLPLEGPFVSMKYETNTKQLLVSSRPNNRITYARHTLCHLEKREEKIDCNIVHTFQGGGMQKLLSKSCFLSHTNDYVAAHQENCKSVFLWSINTGQKVASITAHESVLDLKGLQNQNGNFLVSLTDKKLEFFKFA